MRRPSASNAPSTAAAPDMSYFISSICAAGLIEMPPVSNVTPLPTSATGAASPAPRYSSTMNRGSVWEPCATASAAPMPFLPHLLAVQHGHREAVGLAELLRDLGEVGGRAGVGRQELEPPRQRLPFRHRLPDLEAGPRGRLFARLDHRP